MIEILKDIFSPHNVCMYFLVLIFYSVAGWLFETLLHLVRDRKIVKRGFLFGPLCPIYGVGALLQIIILYQRIDNIFLLFLAGVFISGALEYSTHYILEKCFHAMWWDYSSRRFNINGRVYLNGLIFMGIGTVFVVKYIHPFVLMIVNKIPLNIFYIICFVIYSLLLMDIATTIAELKNSVAFLRHFLDTAIKESQNVVDNTEEKINELSDQIKNNRTYVELIQKLSNEKSPITKFKNRFPDFSIQKYKDILDIIRDKPDESKARKDIKLYGEENDFEDSSNNEKK